MTPGPRLSGCAASVAVSGVLTGPIRTVTVTATLGRAVYLSTLDPDTPAICLVSADAVRVPCAVVLPAGVPVPAPPVGSRAWVGDGRIAFAGCGAGAVVTRWWRPAQPTGVAPLLSESLDSYEVVGAGGTDRLRSALVSAADGPTDPATAEVATAVTGLLGGGPGLTPLGDDVLAGALVALIAGRHPAGRVLARAVRAALHRPGPAPTTAVSAALLAHAMRGECIPELGALLTTGTPAAVAALLAVGHSSGAGMLLGVRTALAVRPVTPLLGRAR